MTRSTIVDALKANPFESVSALIKELGITRYKASKDLAKDGFDIKKERTEFAKLCTETLEFETLNELKVGIMQITNASEKKVVDALLELNKEVFK